MRTQERQYNDGGVPGRVKQSQSRTTGQPVSLYYAEQAGIEADHPWVVVCETHQQQASYPTLRQAEKHIPLGDWCAACVAAPKRTIKKREHTTPPNPQKGRRTSRFVSVSSNRYITFGKESYDHLGNPDWIELTMEGNDVVLRATEEPEKQRQGIHKATAISYTGVMITAVVFIADNKIANGKYIPVLKGKTVRFVPDRIPDLTGGPADA